MFFVKDKHTPLQLSKIKDEEGKIYELVDVNSGEVLRTTLSNLLILSIEDNGRCYPIKYSRLGKAIELFEEGIINSSYQIITLETKQIVAII